MLISSSIGGRAEGTDSQCNMSRCLNNEVAINPHVLAPIHAKTPKVRQDRITPRSTTRRAA